MVPKESFGLFKRAICSASIPPGTPGLARVCPIAAKPFTGSILGKLKLDFIGIGDFGAS